MGWRKIVAVNLLKFAIGAAIGMALLRACQTKSSLELRDGEEARAIVDIRAGTLGLARKGQAARSSQPVTGLRRATLTVTRSPEGKTYVKLTAKTNGLTFEPGVGLVHHRRLYGMADVQWWYWKNFGAHAGILGDGHGSITPYVGGSFRLGLLGMPNTSLACVMDSDKKFFVGIRIGL